MFVSPADIVCNIVCNGVPAKCIGVFSVIWQHRPAGDDGGLGIMDSGPNRKLTQAIKTKKAIIITAPSMQAIPIKVPLRVLGCGWIDSCGYNAGVTGLPHWKQNDTSVGNSMPQREQFIIINGE